MRDLLWVKKERICRVGDRIYLVFRVRNRARGAEFRLGDVEVLAGEQRLDTRVVVMSPDRKTMRFEDVRLGLNDEVLGVVTFPESDGSDPVLRITEDGGKQRVVDVEEAGF